MQNEPEHNSAKREISACEIYRRLAQSENSEVSTTADGGFIHKLTSNSFRFFKPKDTPYNVNLLRAKYACEQNMTVTADGNSSYEFHGATPTHVDNAQSDSLSPITACEILQTMLLNAVRKQFRLSPENKQDLPHAGEISYEVPVSNGSVGLFEIVQLMQCQTDLQRHHKQLQQAHQACQSGKILGPVTQGVISGGYLEHLNFIDPQKAGITEWRF